MKNATVSIVIPVFNRAHLVHRAIDSALMQTFSCEILLVDHGSTDDIATVVEKYGDKIHYIRRDNDNGPIDAWLDGAKHASGEYLHFTYDDDWIEPNFIQECISKFDSDIAFVYSRAYISTLETLNIKPHLIHPPGKQDVSLIAKYLLTTPFTISPGCAVFRRNDVLKNLLPHVPDASGIYGKNTGVGEDVLLFLLTTLNYSYYIHIPKQLAAFLAHDGSITIDAVTNGKQDLLRESYSYAKNYYLMQPGAIKKPNGLSILIFKFNWFFRKYFSYIFSS